MYTFCMFVVDLEQGLFCLQFCWSADYYNIIIKTCKNETFQEETQIFIDACLFLVLISFLHKFCIFVHKINMRPTYEKKYVIVSVFVDISNKTISI